MGAVFDPRFLPSYNDANAGNDNKASPFLGGLGAGVHGLLGLGSSALEGVAKLEGADKVADLARGWADTQDRIAGRIRPDLDVAPWQQGGASVLPWAEYQLAKLAPTLAGFVGSTFVAPEATIPTAIARGLPEVLGGLAADAEPAAVKAASKFVLGGGTFGGATGFGQAVQSADQQPGGLTQSGAAQALAETPVYAAAGILTPGFLKDAIGAAGNKGLLSTAAHIATKGIEGSAVGAFQAGTTTALDQTFRSDLSTRDKMNNIIDATVQGAAVGGLAGGLAGGLGSVRALKRADPNSIVTDDLNAATAGVDPANQQPPGPPLLTGTVYADPAGRAAQDANSLVNGSNLLGYDTIANSKQGSLRWARPYDQGLGEQPGPANGFDQGEPVQGPVRPYGEARTEELQAISHAGESYLAGLPDDHKLTERDVKVRNQLQLVNEELSQRNISESAPAVDAASAGAVEPSRGPSVSGPAGGAEIAPAPAKSFGDALSDLLNGRKLPGRFKADIAGAKNGDELLSKVHSYLDDKRPTVLQFAQDLGLLDEQHQPTPLAAALDARKADEAASKPPVDTEFQKKWADLTSTKGLRQNDPVRELPTPANAQEAQKIVFDALTRDRGDPTIVGPSSGEVSDALEKIAQSPEIGLLNEDKQPTKTMVDLSRPQIGLKEAVQAAEAAGLKGAAVSQFDRGARWTEDKGSPKFDNLEEAMAFQKGHDWANPKTLTEGETQGAVQQLGLGDNFEAGQQIPEEQRSQRWLNQAIDERYDPTVHPEENAQLKAMVREGDDGTALNEAERYFKSGHGALVNAPAPVRPSDPNVIPTMYGDTYRPDPTLKNATSVREIGRTKAAVEQLGSQERKANDYQSIVKYRLHESLKNALKNKDVNAGQYALLHQAIDNNDHARVRDALTKIGSLPYVHMNGRTVTTGRDWIAAADVLLKQHESGGGAQTLMSHLKSVPGPVGNMAKRFEKYVPSDVKVDIKLPEDMAAIYHGETGQELPQRLWSSLQGHYNPNSRVISLNSSMDHPSVALHEIMHAVTADHINNETPIGREMIAMYNKFKNSGPASDYAFRDPHEFMAEFLSRQQVRDYVKNAQPTVFQRVWNAIRNMLGRPSKDYVEHILKLAERAGAEPVSRSDWNSPVGLNKLTRDHVENVIDSAEKLIKSDDAKGVVRKTALGWATVHDIGQHWGKWFDPKRFGEAFKNMVNPILAYEKHLGMKQSIVARMAQMMTTARDAVDSLDKGTRQTLVRLMGMSEFGINPTKDWEHQSDRVRNSPNKENLQKLHAEAYALYQKDLVRSKDGRGARAYQHLHDVNDVMMLSQMSATLHSQAASDVRASHLPEFAVGPMERFLDAQNNQDFTPETARKWWRDELKTQLDALDTHFRSSTAEAHQLGEKGGKILKQIEPLQLRSKKIQQTIAQIETAPYFHLGRFGNHFVGWHVTSQEALGKVADYLEKEGFKAGVISRESDKVNTYVRVETQWMQDRLHAAIETFAKENPGMIDPDHTVAGERTSQVIRNSMADQWLDSMKESLRTNEDLDSEAKDAMISHLEALHLDLMPENSLSRVMTHREGVPGYDSDMMRAFEHRANVGINALAGMVIAPKISRAFTDMRSLQTAAQHADRTSVPTAMRNGMTNVLDELSRREFERPQWPQTKFLDQLRAINHAWFLGGSISYGLVNLTQLGATLLPELGARHGFIKSAKTMAEVTPMAWRIVKAIAAEGAKVSISRATDAVVTRGALDRAGVPPKIAEFIMRVANSGELDIGGASRELMRAAAGEQHGAVNSTLRYASAIGYYTETASRLVAALSSYHLDGIKDPEEAAARAVYVLKESMWDYSQANQGREFGKMGVLGRYTPLATAFMQYTAQLTGKLYRETYEAIKGETPEERAEARRFLLQHAVGMTVLAGSLGLPMVSALAATVDRLKDEFDGDGKPSDVRAAWRNLLSDTFGKDVGEVLSRGVSRSVGVDISSRVGEQDILPFSKMIADRRNFKDSIKDMQARSWGAPTSMVANALQGGEAIVNGDFLGGMQRMLPNALAAPAKALQMTDKGFVDANGKVLPMKPSTRDIVAQLLGFSPSDRAEYQEARQDQAVSKGLITRQATVLRNSLVQSILGGDRDSARSALDQIKDFNNANPAYEIKGTDIEGMLRRQAEAAATAQATRSPLGVRPQDVNAQQLTRYANY